MALLEKCLNILEKQAVCMIDWRSGHPKAVTDEETSAMLFEHLQNNYWIQSGSRLLVHTYKAKVDAIFDHSTQCQCINVYDNKTDYIRNRRGLSMDTCRTT